MVEDIDRASAKKEGKNEYSVMRFQQLQTSPSRQRLKRGQQSKGRSVPGITTKLHLAITPDFCIIEGFVTGGNQADISVADNLTAEVSGCYVIEDKGYDSTT